MKRHREIGIEAYRIFLTFLICLIHAIGFGPRPSLWATSAITFSVCGFVFISGWFGIKFSLSKMLRLLMLGVYCGAIAFAAGWLAGFTLTLEQTVEVFCRMWFLCAYLVLMLLSPILNVAARHIHDEKRMIVGGLILLVIWNWSVSVRVGRIYLPITSGLGSYTFTMMICVYMLARIVRMAYDEGMLKIDAIGTVPMAGIFIALMVVCGFGWRICAGCYASPFAMATALVGFFLFKRVKVGSCASRVLSFVSPSTFAIIIYHGNVIGAKFVHLFEEKCLYFAGGGAIITALALFSIGLMLDVLRRSMLALVESRWQKIS